MTEDRTEDPPVDAASASPPAGEGEADATPRQEPEEYAYLPPLTRAAIKAFERELPRLREELLAQGCTEKEWVAFHGDRYLGHARRQYDLLEKVCGEGGVPEDEVYCHALIPLDRRIIRGRYC